MEGAEGGGLQRSSARDSQCVLIPLGMNCCYRLKPIETIIYQQSEI